MLTAQAEKQADELSGLRDKLEATFNQFSNQVQELSQLCTSDNGCEQDMTTLHKAFISDSCVLKAKIASKNNELNQTQNKIAEFNSKIDAYIQKETNSVVVPEESGTRVHEELTEELES